MKGHIVAFEKEFDPVALEEAKEKVVDLIQGKIPNDVLFVMGNKVSIVEVEINKTEE